MEEEKYLPELMAEKDILDPSFVHAMRLLAEEIEKFQESEAKKEDEEKKYLDIISNKNIKLSERVLIPVKQYPKEEELRKSGEAKYAHLSDELHVLIEVFAPPGEAYSRMSHALEEIKKFLVPDYNDEIRQEQLRELSYLNGSEESNRGKVTRGRGIRLVATTVARSRGGATPHPLSGRGTPGLRSSPVLRGALPLPPVARGVPAARARGVPTAPGFRAPPPAIETYDDYGYDDGFGEDYDEQSYEDYENNYSTQLQSVPEYYDYGHGTNEENYNNYGEEEWSSSRSSLKAPLQRTTRGGYREHPYGRY
ncbi:KH domain-containing, RNA-binding, signal transduction-associated protein 2 isoform X2 [Hyla sarda]|uniref:KH domain-containing, RNA-binding, signal transduction-associated protein 2 isoform X2 n=1 Tax=Hyla sarda TaxID=327740 RepID=UPI0024C41793|nr:KH domain-containing, RNA-binding, signal transduction-associated protein 2 isoform X2 [Hyla sarda]